MSVALESPSHRSPAGDGYCSPHSLPPSISSPVEANGDNAAATTPFFTPPISPSLHQEFFNAIQAHHNSRPTVLGSEASVPKKHSSPLVDSRGRNQSSLSASTSNLANRRRPMSKPLVSPIDVMQLRSMLSKDDPGILILDVRSFVQYSHARIRTAINISVPNTILKRPSFTMDKVYEAVVSNCDRDHLRRWRSMHSIIFCDQSSETLPEQCAVSYLSNKLNQAGYKGEMYYVKGGFEAAASQHLGLCESASPSTHHHLGQSLPSRIMEPSDTRAQLASGAAQCRAEKRAKDASMSLKLPADQAGLHTAPMPQFDNQSFNPFFSNIRQNLELCHGPIRERLPVRLPSHYFADSRSGQIKVQQGDINGLRCIPGVSHVENDIFIGPKWLREAIIADAGPQILAEMYERIERMEQKRLQNVMLYHSKHTDSHVDTFPLSIIAGMEMGALNRYTNVWPFEYSRVKIASPQSQPTDYMNANFIQYAKDYQSAKTTLVDVSQASLEAMKRPASETPFRRYISTQGPLPATFGDFWQMVWEQGSRVLVMLTKEEEMNKIKCHCYWPCAINQPVQYGAVTVRLLSETVQPIGDNSDDKIIIRQLLLQSGNSVRRPVTHIQYTGWPDFGVPDSPIGTLQVVNAADQAQVLYESEQDLGSQVGPMIVHCSAGCGRSGAFCAIDTVIRRLSAEVGDTDLLFDTISRFREQRMSMVQTLRQFVFCYETIWWWLLGKGHLPASPSPMDTDT